MKRNFLIVFAFVCFASHVLAQDAKKLGDAQKLFALKGYDRALPLYVEAIQSGIKDPLAFYQTGICYLKQQNVDDQVKGIPYFETALKEGKGLPNTLNLDLGQLYLKNEQLDKALETLTLYKNGVKADPKATVNANKLIEICHNAIALMAVPSNFTVHSFPGS